MWGVRGRCPRRSLDGIGVLACPRSSCWGREVESHRLGGVRGQWGYAVGSAPGSFLQSPGHLCAAQHCDPWLGLERAERRPAMLPPGPAATGATISNSKACSSMWQVPDRWAIRRGNVPPCGGYPRRATVDS